MVGIKARAQIGWIGMGKMGLPICKRPRGAGFQVRVLCRSEASESIATTNGFEVARTTSYSRRQMRRLCRARSSYRVGRPLQLFKLATRKPAGVTCCGLRNECSSRLLVRHLLLPTRRDVLWRIPLPLPPPEVDETACEPKFSK
jgi:NAD binding domain of 6-phosphogluconate dehydrogenase